jgi:hypothetical protein
MEPSADALALHGPSPAEVIAGARSGDAAAHSTLYRVHAREMVSLAYPNLKSRG